MFSMPIARDPRSVRDCRKQVRLFLDRHSLGHMAADVALVASELMTNAISHARGGDLQVLAVLLAHEVRLEVIDPGGGLVARKTPSLDGGGGFGLHVVDAVADEWGVDYGPPTR